MGDAFHGALLELLQDVGAGARAAPLVGDLGVREEVRQVQKRKREVHREFGSAELAAAMERPFVGNVVAGLVECTRLCFFAFILTFA